MDIKKIDPNFKVNRQVCDDLSFHRAEGGDFDIYGMMFDEEFNMFTRIDHKVAQKVSDGVRDLNNHLTGGRIVFKSDTQKMGIRFTVPYGGKYYPYNQTMHLFTGFDVYERVNGKQILVKALYPEFDDLDAGPCLSFEIGGGKKEREFIIYTPAYSGPQNIEIGIEKGASLKKGNKYNNEKPVVFYGSSIVHGAAAQRPALTYPAMISQEYNLDFINLGFSGNAKGEDEIADYIADLDMDAFVYDYDHNAPTVGHLKDTHERMYLKVREKHREIPFILLSRPQSYRIPDGERKERRDIVFATYMNAAGRGENVYFIDGEDIYKDFGGKEFCAADDSHPNVLGFYAMSRKVGEILGKILKEN